MQLRGPAGHPHRPQYPTLRLLVLYLRSRRLPVAVVATAATAVGLSAVGHAAEAEAARLALLAIVAGVAAAGPGLAGADIELDRTAAIVWAPRRAVHVIGAAVVTGAATLIAFTGGLDVSTAQIARDALGMSGLVALGVAVLGAERAWVLPTLWTLLGWMLLVVAPPGSHPATLHTVVTWMVQDSGSTASAVTAVAVAAVGTLAYVLVGPRR
jgi:hypothetical protein